MKSRILISLLIAAALICGCGSKEHTETDTTADQISSTETTTETTYEYPRNYGDVNVDGKVDIADAIFLNKYLAGQIALSVAGTLNADCNASGHLDDADTTILMAYVLMKITDLPYIQE